MGRKTIDMTGARVGRWTVLRQADTLIGAGRTAKWECECDCGTKSTVSGSSLRKGVSLSCGCLAREKLAGRNRTHGMSDVPEHGVWAGMKSRCYNKGAHNYSDYGGRGIRVCDEWVEDFSNFYGDMGPRPSTLHTIERIDVNGDYCPENCVWATPKEQANNRRTTVWLEVNGENMTASQASEKFGVPYATLIKRLRRCGIRPDEAIMSGDRRLRKNR